MAYCLGDEFTFLPSGTDIQQKRMAYPRPLSKTILKGTMRGKRRTPEKEVIRQHPGVNRKERCRDAGACQDSGRMEERCVAIYHAAPPMTPLLWDQYAVLV